MKRAIFLILLFASVCFGQAETLSNSHIVELTKSGLPVSIIVKKIKDSENNFDVSVSALVALKEAGVDPEVIALMLERAPKRPVTELRPEIPVPAESVGDKPRDIVSRTEKRTIAITKSSIHPSLQALEKELLKRREWNAFNLEIIRYKESADFYVEIGRVPLSWVTHRYAFRVYDRRSGAVIAAGETTSWGSLAENLAREIAKSISKAFSK